jgi:hypothetical protein
MAPINDFRSIVGQFLVLKSVLKKSFVSWDKVWWWTEMQGLSKGMSLQSVDIYRIEGGIDLKRISSMLQFNLRMRSQSITNKLLLSTHEGYHWSNGNVHL